MSFLKNIVSGYLGNRANQKLSGIKNPHARRIAGNLLGASPVGDYIPGLRNPPRNPDQNLLFGARMLSELQLRQELQGQSEQFGSIKTEADQQPLQKNYDWRARLRPKRGGENYVYGTMYADQSEIGGTNILQPIIDSGGLVWQYTPQIFVSAGANYNVHELQGMNYPIHSYLHSRPPELPIASEFTANNIDEARYLLAVITFLKVTTKSFAGESAVAQGVAGTPPPVLLFEYLGEHGFNKVPVIIKDYSIQYGEDIDYVPVHYKMGGEDTVTYVPTAALISINLSVNYTPQKLRKRYDITSLTTGQGYMDGFI
jgi:hypothetical protein|tara:strand:- start:35903 stop:36844 length:942 start_codon:yes stop_codon:yes gene_type:complete